MELNNILRPLLGSSKEVIQLDSNRNPVREWPSASEAAREYGLSQPGITYAIKNGTELKGFYWKFKNDTEKMIGELDVAGQKIHEFTILENIIYEAESKEKRLRVRCSCGKERFASIGQMLDGSLKSCGHLRGKKAWDPQELVGKVFGKLTVKEFTEQKSKRYFFNCLCECGREVKSHKEALIKGDKISCGLCDSSYMLEARKHIGEKHNRLTIVDVVRVETKGGLKHGYKMVCNCECGGTTSAVYASMVDGSIKSCGCLVKETSSIIGSTHGIHNWKHTHDWYFYNKGVKVNCKSGFEVVYANWLTRQGLEFQYEPETFKLGDGKRYIPDFYIPSLNKYVDPKGSQITENTIRQAGNIELFKKDHNLEVIGWDDLVVICNLKFKSYSTFHHRCKSLGIDQPDYFNNFQDEIYN